MKVKIKSNKKSLQEIQALKKVGNWLSGLFNKKKLDPYAGSAKNVQSRLNYMLNSTPDSIKKDILNAIGYNSFKDEALKKDIDNNLSSLLQRIQKTASEVSEGEINNFQEFLKRKLPKDPETAKEITAALKILKEYWQAKRASKTDKQTNAPAASANQTSTAPAPASVASQQSKAGTPKSLNDQISHIQMAFNPANKKRLNLTSNPTPENIQKVLNYLISNNKFLKENLAAGQLTTLATVIASEIGIDQKQVKDILTVINMSKSTFSDLKPLSKAQPAVAKKSPTATAQPKSTKIVPPSRSDVDPRTGLQENKRHRLMEQMNRIAGTLK